MESDLGLGETRRITLHDARTSVEISGRIQWLRSGWREETALASVRYIRLAGMAIEQILTPNATGIWSRLETARSGGSGNGRPRQDVDRQVLLGAERQALDAQLPSRSTRRTISVPMPAPPKLLEPENGATVDVASLEVTCSVSMPEEIVSVSINGSEAKIVGEQATASVGLDSGPNRLTALIRRHSGHYRSFSLGQVTRKES